ncbi:MAG: AraC family transcriptional regulator [Stenotrophobium sp.]
MIKKPQVLSETPALSADVLSDLLGGMHLAGAVMFRAEFRAPWSVSTPGTRKLAQTLPFRTEYIIPFHVIAAGGCWLELPEQAPVWLDQGDAVLLPYGISHRLGSRDAAETVPLGQLLPPRPWSDMPVVRHGGTGTDTDTGIICGFVQCDELLIHPILRHLPVLLHVRPSKLPADSWLASTIRHTATEACHPTPGSRGMLPRLTELMFVEILRDHIRGLSADEVGWFAAVNDPVAGAALKYLHAAPLQPWSVETLARHVGVSRTVLAERFKHFLDQPPMHYLARWRLQLAAQHLKASDLPIKSIVDRSGYESEAAFSHAFKRHFGLSPKDWRRQQSPP